MSKKMLKRSLTLGALMAFVITGSAMAADTVRITKTDEIVTATQIEQTNDAYACALYANNGSANIVNATNITATGVTKADGVRSDYSALVFKEDTTISSIASGNDSYSYGVRVLGDTGKTKSTVSFEGNNTSITAKGDYAWGVAVSGGNESSINLEGSEVKITVEGEKAATGIQTQYGSNAVTADSNTSIKMNVTSSGYEACGIVAMTYAGSTGNINLAGTLNADVKNTGSGTAYGVYGENGAKVNLADTTITAISEKGKAYGIYAVGEDNKLVIGDEGKKVNITTNAYNYTEGVLLFHRDGDKDKDTHSELTLKGDEVRITVHSKNSYAVGIDVGNDTLDEKVETNKVVIDAKDTYITATTDKAEQYTGEWNTYGLVNYSQGVIEINNGNLTVDATTALSTRGNATTEININNNPDYIVKLTGDISYNGASDDGTMSTNTTINLANSESFLTGNIVKTGSGVDDKTPAGMTLGLSDGATWTTVADEINGEKNFVNTLNMNGGILNVAEGTKVTVGVNSDDIGWYGDGTVVVNSLDAAQVTINKKAEGSNVTVQGSEKITDTIAASANQATEMQKLADTVQDDKKVSAANTITTTESEIAGAITAQVDDEGKVIASTIKEATNTTNQAIGEAAVALKAHWRAHMNDMNKRMGELRMANGETGVWTRMVRGEAEYESAKAQYNQYQLGYDEKLSVDKRWTVGAAVTFAEGDGSYGKGTTEDDSTAFAIYGSKLNNDGTFIDLIARYARMESDITSVTGKTADYSTNGYSVSAEFGKRIQQGNGLWIEPQVELTYGSVDSAEYELDGKNVQVGDMDSLIGRVGFSLGKDIKQGNVYARASYLYDFDGETETTFTANGITRPIEEDLGGGWWEVGVGANINLSKATYIYADVEKTFGGEVDTNWQWNLGVRYSF